MSARAPEDYNPSDYPPFGVAVDLCVFTLHNGVFSILLVERAEEPYAGDWALPGGFVGAYEDAMQAAWRELTEETGVERFPGHLEQLKTYTAPERDPRMRVVSVAHVALAPNLPTPRAGSDAKNARWWAVDDLGTEDGPTLAFDHEEIVVDAIERVRSKIEYTTLATQFTPEPFTMSDLHRVYTAVWGFPPDLPNLQRKVQSTPGMVVATDETADTGKRGPRPRLYRRGDATAIHPPLMRSDQRRADEG